MKKIALTNWRERRKTCAILDYDEDEGDMPSKIL